jgi:hypothetical protein
VLERSFELVLEETLRIIEAQRDSNGNINHDLVEIAVPERLAIVGDLHGDLQTLEKILNELDSAGFLEDRNSQLVFLGDYIDRGKNSVSVLYTLFKLKCDFPDGVILMKGNHEAPLQFPFRQHDFPAKMQEEFINGRELYQKTLTIFEVLPVATVVTEKLLLVHGGLPRIEDMENARKILSLAGEQKKVLEEILWNDPRELGTEQSWEKSRRSYGVHFGRPVTNAWIRALGVKAVVRGHEPSPGFNITHGGKILTLFSCRESYPSYGAAFISASKQELEALKNAEDLIPCIHKL